MPPVMKSIQQKHVTDHRATYCYKPQRAILIIALQKISRFVFNGVPSKRFSFIELHFYYTINMAIFQVSQAKKTPCCLLCFSHTYILLLQKTAFFRLAPFYQPQKSVQPERSRKHNFKLKICFFLLDRASFFSSTPQNSEQAPHFQSKTPHSLIPTPQSERKTTPSRSGCDSNLVSINFCVATQKSAENEVFCPTFGWFYAYNRLLSTTSANSPDGRKAACAIVTAQAALFFPEGFFFDYCNAIFDYYNSIALIC